MRLLELYRKILSLPTYKHKGVDISYRDDDTLIIGFFMIPPIKQQYRTFTIKEEDKLFSFTIHDCIKYKTLKISYEVLYRYLFVDFFKDIFRE